MSRLATVSWKRFERFLLHIGCTFERQTGDHRIYHREGLKRPLVIPMEHDLPVFIIRNNLRLLNIDPQEYLSLLKNL